MPPMNIVPQTNLLVNNDHLFLVNNILGGQVEGAGGGGGGSLPSYDNMVWGYIYMFLYTFWVLRIRKIVEQVTKFLFIYIHVIIFFCIKFDRRCMPSMARLMPRPS